MITIITYNYVDAEVALLIITNTIIILVTS